ncbi:hypothetical protein [Psychromonas aquimarina]|uniref:hypothetical protein n=1 Tax=Psychromonas aquimarina TaxID=444919 RepID=UPI000419F758|nr:hypothetical protein [Psychromonas aquimarina]
MNIQTVSIVVIKKQQVQLAAVHAGGESAHQFLIPNSQNSVLSTLSETDSAEREYAKRQYTAYGED